MMNENLIYCVTYSVFGSTQPDSDSLKLIARNVAINFRTKKEYEKVRSFSDPEDRQRLIKGMAAFLESIGWFHGLERMTKIDEGMVCEYDFEF
jgi:hypothetical protein